MSQQEPDGTQGSDWSRWRRPVLLTVLIVLAVWILFTWVFPWVTEMGLSPTME